MKCTMTNYLLLISNPCNTNVYEMKMRFYRQYFTNAMITYNDDL